MESSGKRGAGWRTVAAFIGLAAALVLYYWAHKPLDPTVIVSLGGAALDVLVAALIVMVPGGLGHRICQTIWHDADYQTITRSERVALEGLLGLGVLSLLALTLGLVGLYRGAILWLMLLVIGVVCLRDVVGWVRDVLALVRRALQPENGWMRFLSLFVLILLFAALLHAVMPPTAFDAINYHLVGPTRYLAAGRITAQPDNHFLGFPQGMEVLYGVAISLFGRDTTAAPLHGMVGVLGLLAVGGMVKRHTNPAAGMLAIALLLSAFSVWLLFGWPYVDLGVMAYSAAALVAATVWREITLTPALSPSWRGEIKWLVLMGVFGGLAMGVKYTSVGLMIGLVILVVVSAPRQAIRNVLVLSIAALLVFLPWAVKGMLLYQNPVYPFLLGGLNWDAGRSNTFSTTGTGLLGSANAWHLVVLPIAATVFGVEKGDNYSFTAGPWLLTAPLLLMLVWRWLDDQARGLARVSLTIGLPTLGFWMVMAALSSIGVQTRLAMMAMPTFAAAGAVGFYGLSRLPRKPLDMWFIARALLALTMIFTVLDVVRDTVRMNLLPYLVGNLSRADTVARNVVPGQSSYVAAMQELGNLPEGSQVRLMWETRSYYCPPTVTCIPDILFDHWPRTLRADHSPDEVFQVWRDAGDDYLLVFNAGYQFNVQDTRFPENSQFQAIIDTYMTPVWSDEPGLYTLYGWKDGE